MELRTPFKASAGDNNILYSMDVQYMLSHAMSYKMGQTLLGLLVNSNFNDCLPNGADHQRSCDLLETLKNLPCSVYAKSAFVKTLASHHGIVDSCRKHFSDPDHENLFCNDREWERNYTLVCCTIGGLTLQRKADAENNIPSAPSPEPKGA